MAFIIFFEEEEIVALDRLTVVLTLCSLLQFYGEKVNVRTVKKKDGSDYAYCQLYF